MNNPKLTAFSFSGGKQSSCILWMVLNGDLERPKNFIVLNADPGMENSGTYPYVAKMEKECEKANIPFLRTSRNLYQELLDFKTSGKKRFDMPPYWVKDKDTGKIGRLPFQGCTYAYKIAGMDRLMRKWMEENLGISSKSKRIGKDVCCKWIGFAADEWHRVKDDPRYIKKYVYQDYPLINKNMTKIDCETYLINHNLTVPPPSVCNACFSHNLMTLKDMYENRKHDWEQAVLIDETIRDMSIIGVRGNLFVSSTCIPLKNLAELNFILPKDMVEIDAKRCHSGHCFL